MYEITWHPKIINMLWREKKIKVKLVSTNVIHQNHSHLYIILYINLKLYSNILWDVKYWNYKNPFEQAHQLTCIAKEHVGERTNVKQ